MKLISFGTTFLSLEELTLVLTLLFVVAGFLIVIGFRKAGFAMIGSALVLALLPVFEPFLDPILTLIPDWAFWLLIGLFGLTILRWVLNIFIGREAANSAIGNLVASAIKGVITAPLRALRKFF